MGRVTATPKQRSLENEEVQPVFFHLHMPQSADQPSQVIDLEKGAGIKSQFVQSDQSLEFRNLVGCSKIFL